MTDKDFRFSDQKCPYCEHVLNACFVPGSSGVTPSPGDFTLCIECAGISVFGEENSIRKVTQAELIELDPADYMHLQAQQKIIQDANPRTTH